MGINKKEFKNKYYLRVCLGEISLDSLTFNSSEVSASVKHFFNITNKCRYCGKELTSGLEVTQSYWSGYFKGESSPSYYPCCGGCKAKGFSKEVYECQCIDASCNDCGHFNCTEETREIRKGTCSKKGTIVKTYPQFCFGNPCFEHRGDK